MLGKKVKRNTGIYSGDYRGSVIQKEFRRGCKENHCYVGLSQGLYQPAGSRLYYFLPSMLKAKWLLCCLLAFIIFPLNPLATVHQRDLLTMLILYLKLIIDYQLDLFNYLNMLSKSILNLVNSIVSNLQGSCVPDLLHIISSWTVRSLHVNPSKGVQHQRFTQFNLLRKQNDLRFSKRTTAMSCTL